MAVRSARVALVWLAIALAAVAASAESTILVGVDSVRFAWTPAAGAPLGYSVSVSYRSGAPIVNHWVTETSIDLPVAPGDRISIAVAAGARDGSGVFRLGAQSPFSDPVWIVRSPRFAASGTWLLQCASCPSLALRSLADASDVVSEGPGLPAPWRVVARAALASGADLLVWRNPTTGELEIWDSEELQPIPGGTALGPRLARAVGSADFDGDGIEEFLLQNLQTNTVSLWALTPGGFERVAVLPDPEAFLAVAEDLTGDGKIDLVWHEIASGRVYLWNVVGDPRVGGPLTSVYQLPSSRLVTGLPSDVRVVNTGDYDGDGQPDLLLRYGDGRLAILYLYAGSVRRFTALPGIPGDVDRSVVGSIDVDGIPGDEIALRDRITGAISILLPAYTSEAARILVLTPGSRWRAVDVSE